MITLENFKEILTKSGFPVAYHSFPEKEVPSMPYIIYVTPYARNFKADGRVYSSVSHIQVELYTQVKDMDAEAKVEAALETFYYSKSETGLDSEKCYEVIYELEV